MSSKAFIHIPKEKMKHYHQYFDEYRHGRKFIDTMKNMNLGNLWVDEKKKPGTLFYQIPWCNIFAGNPSYPKIDELFQHVPSEELIFYPNKDWKTAIHLKWGKALDEIKRITFGETTIKLSKLRKMIESLPDGYSLERVDLESAKYIDDGGWWSCSRAGGAWNDCSAVRRSGCCWAASGSGASSRRPSTRL